MFTLITALLVTLTAAEVPVDAPLPSGATPMEDPGRYRTLRTFEETLDFYRKLFNQTGGVRWRNIVNLPSIKAKHVECLAKKTHWEGINIYEKQGEVRIYVIPRDAAEKDQNLKRKRPSGHS